MKSRRNQEKEQLRQEEANETENITNYQERGTRKKQHIEILRDEPTMRYHYRAVRIAKIQNTDTTKCWGECGATGTLTHCW